MAACRLTSGATEPTDAGPAVTGATRGETDDVVVIAAARAQDALLDLARALARRAARRDFAAAQAPLQTDEHPDALR